MWVAVLNSRPLGAGTTEFLMTVHKVVCCLDFVTPPLAGHYCHRKFIVFDSDLHWFGMRVTVRRRLIAKRWKKSGVQIFGTANCNACATASAADCACRMPSILKSERSPMTGF